eukprot:gene5567-9385_t
MSETIEKNFTLETYSDEQLNTIESEYKSMITNKGISVHDLSMKHSVVLMFIKWYGCPIFQEVIAEVGRLLPPMLKLNTIPVIVHQGEKVADNYMSKSRDSHVKNLLYAKTTKNPSGIAIVVLESWKMSRKIIFESLDKRVDFPMILPGNKSEASSELMKENLQYHPNFEWKIEFQRTNSRILTKIS